MRLPDQPDFITVFLKISVRKAANILKLFLYLQTNDKFIGGLNVMSPIFSPSIVTTVDKRK